MYDARAVRVVLAASLGVMFGLSFTPAQAETELVSRAQEDTIAVANMDKAVAPGKDFYLYSNGTWLKNTPIPPDYASWGVFNILREKNLALMKEIVERSANNPKAEAGSNERKIGDFYAAGMDEQKIEAEGVKPLEDEFKRINAMKSVDDLQNEIARLHGFGIEAGFSFSSGQDFKDSNQVIAQASQGGLGLPDRDYYTNTDDNSKNIRSKYLVHVSKMFQLLGNDQAAADAKAQKIMALETQLATASMVNTDLRVPEKVYHKMTLRELTEMTPDFSWSKYFSNVGFPSIAEANVGQPEFFKTFNKTLSAVSMDDWKNYLTWHLLEGASPYLSNKFVDEEFDFAGKVLSGKKQNLPRWKRVIQMEDHEIGQALGQIYVKEHFPPEAKERALNLVHHLKAVLREEINIVDWMGPDTKKNALVKLDAFTDKIGYPDKWRDYSKLQLDRQSYVWNVFRSEQFEFNRQLTKIGKPVDRTEWLMTPQTVNAYYEAEMNEIVFPAGILQPPLFDYKADDATNLGGIGMVIGHEMTHGFDDEGSKFDGAGNMKNWWTADDSKRFDERVSLIVNQYDSYIVAGDTHLKGKLVSGEAAADLGGLTIAYKALERSLDGKPRLPDATGYTPEQRFFISFAQGWSTNLRPEYERLMANTNPHPTPHLRVNGTLANMDSFEKAFSLKDDSPMMLPPDKRCHLW